MKQYTLIFTVIIFTIQILNAQNSAFAPPSIPTSPQAEAFKKYGEYSINYQTGIPDISIPLFEINHYGYKLPIALNYNPIPLKPGYNYDVYGRGWSLSLRSCISRSIKYAPDEWSDFKIEDFSTGEFTLSNIAFSCPNLSCFKYTNFEHDKFNAILPDGSSFEFIIEKINGIKVFKLSNNRQLKITCNASTLNINSFTIIDENGIKYSFEESDYLDETGYLSNVAWHLTSIENPNTNQSIIFSYGLTISNNFIINEPSVHLGHGTNLPYEHNVFEDYNIYYKNIDPILSAYRYRMKLLTSISYGNCSILLNYQNQESYSEFNPPTFSYIENIVIKDNEKQISKIDFDISSSPFLDNITNTLQLGTLNAVYLNGNESNNEKYDLIYQGNNSFRFNGTDHWGNLNWQSYNYSQVGNFNVYIDRRIFDGQASFPSSINILQTPNSPENLTSYNYKIKLQNSFNLSEDERKPADQADHGILKTIKYPSGGYTEFEFENHEFLTANNLNGDYIPNPSNRIKSKASGFRIKTIKNFTEEGIIADVKNFRYGMESASSNYPNSIEHSGLGEAIVDPNIFTYSRFSTLQYVERLQNMLRGVNGFRQEYPTEPVYMYDWECTFNSLNFRALLNGRPPVIYAKVTIYYGDCLDGNYLILPEKTNGKSVYKYDIYDKDENNELDIFFEPLKFIGCQAFYEAKSHRYNNLKERYDYAWSEGVYKCVKKEINSWVHFSQSYESLFFKNTLVGSFVGTMTPIQSLSSGGYQFSLGHHFDIKWNEFCTFSHLTSTISTNYSLNGDSIKSNTNYYFDNKKRLISTNKDDQTTKLKYPDDYSSPVFQKMVEKNMIAPIICYEVDYKGKTQAGNKTIFKEFQFGDQTLILPAEGHKLEFKSTGNEYRLENQILKYTQNGNPLELITKDGIHTCYIWSYDDRYMVANIVGASYNTTGDIVSGTTTLTKSKIDAIVNSITTESNYIQKLSEIRSILISAEVSTYTYKPLIGISTMTDPRGVTTYYEYDEFNRLKQTYIIEGGVKKILQDFQYNYKN